MAAIRFNRLAFALFSLLALSCGEARAPQDSVEATLPRPACDIRSFEGSAFTVCRFDAAKDELRLVLSGGGKRPLRSFAALDRDLGSQKKRLLFAMNAGMYDDNGRPIGLYVEKGQTKKRLNLKPGPGNFHLLPNGVFAVDAKGRLSVTASPAFAKRVVKPLWATQSGPMLVIGGTLHPRFDENGPSQLIRNGVGVKDPRSAYFVISNEGVSFGRFARFFRDALDCPDALFLDGTVSSLWDPAGERRDVYDALGPMIVVLKKED